MNRTRFLLPLAAMLMLAACNDDDNATDPAFRVSGHYDGYSIASCRYFSNQMSPGQSLTLTPSVDGKVNASYTSDSWGSFTITDAIISESDGGYRITGKGETLMGMDGNTRGYNCTMDGTVMAGDATVTFTVPAVMGGLTISFITGEMPVNQ